MDVVRALFVTGTPDQRRIANPSLSPDGKRIAFSRVVGGNWDIWLVDMQGAVSKLTSALSLDFKPVWSPDGGQLFYQLNNASIYSRYSDESQRASVSTTTCHRRHRIRVSRDNQPG